LISILYDFQAVAMSTEKSANFGNVEFKGKQINHQWSKSEEFETMFREYVRMFVTDRVGYSSPLRSMTELQVAELFVKYPQYFRCTTSCNTNWRIVKERPKELWCAKCPKCAFVFALYAAYLPKEKLVEIFGRNLFADDWLTGVYRELLGLEGIKPFECVGTPEETKEAFRLAQKRGDLDDTVIMKMFTKDVR
ncbi:MAG: endonuclease domain-containing protein, partial [Candidatus Peribacteraceae bacterium]|nr:endonuclease domain-containing protein [Candidatus Peribacteraceae bacterium]